MKTNNKTLNSSIIPGWNSVTANKNCFPIGIIKGEGVGPELIATCIPLIEAISEHTPYQFDIRYGGAIGKQAERLHGKSLTQDIVTFCEDIFNDNGAILCGPGGGAFVYKLRAHFDLFCKLAPISNFAALHDTGVIKPEVMAQTDILFVRENSGGLYQGTSQQEIVNGKLTASQQFSYDEAQVKRIIETGFTLAETRRKKVCITHKPGGIPTISDLWMDLANSCSKNHDVDVEFMEVDTAAYFIIADPARFDIVITPNMFGDILADGAALLMSSRGMSYSGNFGENGKAVYQTAHGAAYDIADKGIANPLGQIQSLAMMLKESYDMGDIAMALINSIDDVLSNGIRTADILTKQSSQVGTGEMGNHVLASFKEHLITLQHSKAS